ncbi:MAG: sulfite exporter TauE/SafE family protein [Bacteroidota bacterium]
MIGLWAAFTVGLFGSLHCVGMCGPIAAALPYPSRSKPQLLVSILLYNLGRTLTYSFLGLIFGLLGASFSLIGFQQIMSLTLGISFLMAGIFSFNLEKTLLQWSWTSRIFFFVKSRLSMLLNKKSFRSLFFIGLINGLLPCGLVYVALAGAISTGSVLGGWSWMLAFGAGTIPLMVVAGLSGRIVSISLRNFFKKAYPFVLIIFALLLIVRGLEIQIPNDWYWVQMISEKTFCH